MRKGEREDGTFEDGRRFSPFITAEQEATVEAAVGKDPSARVLKGLAYAVRAYRDHEHAASFLDVKSHHLAAGLLRDPVTTRDQLRKIATLAAALLHATRSGAGDDVVASAAAITGWEAYEEWRDCTGLLAVVARAELHRIRAALPQGLDGKGKRGPAPKLKQLAFHVGAVLKLADVALNTTRANPDIKTIDGPFAVCLRVAIESATGKPAAKDLGYLLLPTVKAFKANLSG